MRQISSTRSQAATQSRASKRVQISLIGQLPVVEFDNDPKAIRIWLSYDETFTTGVFLDCYFNGAMYRVVTKPGKKEISETIRPARKGG